MKEEIPKINGWVVALATMVYVVFGYYVVRYYESPIRSSVHVEHQLAVAGPEEHPRSPKWQKLRDRFIALHSECAFCGNKAETVHHKKPFHLFPELELEESNLVSFCNPCHLRVGHLGNFSNYNPDVEEHIARNQEIRKRTAELEAVLGEAKVKADAARKAKTKQAI